MGQAIAGVRARWTAWLDEHPVGGVVVALLLCAIAVAWWGLNSGPRPATGLTVLTAASAAIMIGACDRLIHRRWALGGSSWYATAAVLLAPIPPLVAGFVLATPEDGWIGVVFWVVVVAAWLLFWTHKHVQGLDEVLLQRAEALRRQTEDAALVRDEALTH